MTGKANEEHPSDDPNPEAGLEAMRPSSLAKELGDQDELQELWQAYVASDSSPRDKGAEQILESWRKSRTSASKSGD